MTIKGDVNRKWVSTKPYRDNYDQIFNKKEESLDKKEEATEEEDNSEEE